MWLYSVCVVLGMHCILTDIPVVMDLYSFNICAGIVVAQNFCCEALITSNLRIKLGAARARSESGISASVYHNSQQCSVTHLICMLCILLGDVLLQHSHR